jgi:uncharacterized protein YjbI with pentapeptide repeats
MDKEELNQTLLKQIREEVNTLLKSYNIVDTFKNIISQGVSEKGNYFSQNYLQSSLIEEFFENNIIRIKELNFYQIAAVEEDDYLFILKKLQKIEFINCIFETKGIVLESKKIFFNDCKFSKQHTINCYDLLDNKDTLYSNCTFNGTVFIKDEINIPLFKDCSFVDSIQANKITFNKPIFLNTKNMKSRRVNQILLTDCIFKSNFIIENSDRKTDKSFFHINRLDLTNSVFKTDSNEKVKVKIQFCEIEEAIFYNTSFYDLADFYQTKFHKVNFERADFFSISVFSETEFMCDVNFNYVKFFGKAIFRDAVITGILNLRDTIFDDEANFLDISGHNRKNEKGEFVGEPSNIKVENRETARIIKNFYDNSNNIIEANRFYKLEMLEREKELDKDMKKSIFEWLVFKIHGLASNHSQDWLLPIFWIISLTFLTSFIKIIDDSFSQNFEKIVLSFIAISIIFFININVSNTKKLYYLICSFVYYFICGVFTKDFSLTIFSNLINPFSIMTGKEELNFGILLYKITIAYLIYQLIISIRQNTRRK